MKYFNGKGKYQKQYNKFYDLLVPTTGAAETNVGEVLRAASRLYYEMFNNGNCNSYDDETNGVTDFYKGFIVTIVKHVGEKIKPTMEKIKEIITQDAVFNEFQNEAYDTMIDMVMEFLLNDFK